MKKIKLILVLMIFLLSFNNVRALEETDQGYDVFIKTDDKGNIVEDAIFVQKRLDGTILKNISHKKITDPGSSENIYTGAPLENGMYPFLAYSNDKVLAFSLLTAEQKEVFNHMNTLDDYNSFVDSIPNLPSDACINKNEYTNYLVKSKGITSHISTKILPVDEVDFNGVVSLPKKYNTSKVSTIAQSNNATNILFNANSYMIIEEVKVPYKLEKETIVVPIKIFLNYSIKEDNSLELTRADYSVLVYIDDLNDRYLSFSKYRDNIDYNKVSDVFSKTTDSDLYSNTCNVVKSYCSFFQTNGLDSGSHLRGSVPSVGGANGHICYPAVVDKTSEEDITKKASVESYVDGKQSVHTQKNSVVTVTVKVTNTARTALYDNVIVSSIPSGFEYVNNSAIKNGVYNSTNNTISWDLDYLDASDSELFSYELRVPSDADISKVYKTSATLTTRGIDTPIISDDAQVDLGDNTSNVDNVTNPKTGNFSQVILIIIALLATMSSIILLNKKSIKSI